MLTGFSIPPYLPFPKQTKDLEVYLVSRWIFDSGVPHVLRLKDTTMLEVTPELEIPMCPHQEEDLKEHKVSCTL